MALFVWFILRFEKHRNKKKIKKGSGCSHFKRVSAEKGLREQVGRNALDRERGSKKKVETLHY